MSTLPNECLNPENPSLFGPTIYISVVEGHVHMYVATIVYFIYFTSFCEQKNPIEKPFKFCIGPSVTSCAECEQKNPIEKPFKFCIGPSVTLCAECEQKNVYVIKRRREHDRNQLHMFVRMYMGLLNTVYTVCKCFLLTFM